MRFLEGFEKTASWKDVWKDRLKGIVTGKRTLYHGTHAAAHRKILNEGIEPKGHGGITGSWQNAIAGKANHHPDIKKQNAGHSFLTEDPDLAKHYSYQANKSRRNYMEDKHPHLKEKLFGGNMNEVTARANTVAKVEVPKKWLHENKVRNPEVSVAMKNKSVEGSRWSKIKNYLRGDFKHHVTVKGGVPKKYIK